KSQRDDGAFSRSDFQYDDQSNSYECPGGKRLTTTGRAKVALSKGRKRKSDTCIKDRGRPRTDQGFCVRSQSADKALPPSSQTEFFNTIDPKRTSAGMRRLYHGRPPSAAIVPPLSQQPQRVFTGDRETMKRSASERSTFGYRDQATRQRSCVRTCRRVPRYARKCNRSKRQRPPLALGPHGHAISSRRSSADRLPR